MYILYIYMYILYIYIYIYIFVNFHIKECTFTVFDIQEFYSSITENLLKQATLFAQNSVNIPPKYIDVIFHSDLFCTIMMIHG